MARPAALGPMQQQAARQMRRTADTLEADHPETVAGAHVRDAARLTETGRHDGAKRHLDAAMQLLTPQSLTRHGIRDDEGHATAKHHMHQVHRHLLHVQDIEDARNRNDEIRTALRAARGQISATDAQAAAGAPLPGHAPPARQQPGQPAVGLAVDLVGPGGWSHGWIRAMVKAEQARRKNRKGRKAYQPGSLTPEQLRAFNVIGPTGRNLPLAVEMSARTAMLERTPAPRGRPGGPGLYHVKGMGHTNYLQQVVRALIEERGMPPDKAYAIARARIRKWAATSRHHEVRAAASRAEAGEIARQARAHTHAIGPWDVADTLIDLVGPKGYVHGWRFVGVPEIGMKVVLPGGHLGMVVGGDHQHARIRTADGSIYKIPHDKGPGRARLVKAKDRPDPTPDYPKLSPERAKMKRDADKAIARGETLFHGSNYAFKVGDVIDAGHSRAAVARLHEGKNYAFASTDAGEATFAGRVSREGHVYRVEPVGAYEYDPHQGSATSRRTSGGFRVVEEVQQWSGKAMEMAQGHGGEIVLAWDHEDGPVYIELAGMAWLHELRGPDGKWIKSGSNVGMALHGGTDKPGKPGTVGRYVLPDPQRLISKTGHKNPADHPFWKAHPVSPANIVAAYDQADEGTRAQGRKWYSDVHDLASYAGQGNAEKGGILLSAFSPQKSWPINMFQAVESGKRGKAIRPGEGMLVTNDQADKAQAAIDGAGIEELMKTAKTHSFGRLIKNGDDSPEDPYGHVVIDTHAVNVAAGGTIRGEEQKKAPIGDARQHEYVADQYRQAAKTISEREGRLMKPHELQAITWLVQQRANQAHDAWLAEHGEPRQRATAKGRASMTKNAWKKWMDYAKIHNIPVVVGTTSLAQQAALAQLIDLVGEDSLTVQLLLGAEPPPFP